MTTRLYSECLNCYKKDCIGCSLYDENIIPQEANPEFNYINHTCQHCKLWYGNDGFKTTVHECYTEATFRCPDWKAINNIVTGD